MRKESGLLLIPTCIPSHFLVPRKVLATFDQNNSTRLKRTENPAGKWSIRPMHHGSLGKASGSQFFVPGLPGTNLHTMS